MGTDLIYGDQPDDVPAVRDTDVLRYMAAEVQACSVEKGWYEEDRTFGEDIALLHSEASEALEAYRDFGLRRHFYRRDDGEFTDEPTNRLGNLNKPIDFASELADVLVRLLDTAARYDVDLFGAWREKVDFNWTRPHRHGNKAL